MPPSGHSHSSHSSHSFSSHSSHSSFGGSSSSRSSFSGSSSRSSFGSSSSRGPSSHSSSSHSSRPLGGGAFSSGSRTVIPNRPRVNQPSGYVPQGNNARRPRTVYGRRHDYIYYPVAWVDAATGVSYEKGYYDENGKRYEDVSFAKDGKYEHVVCHCPYCGQDTVMDLSTKDVGSKQLQCPNCGAPMEIRSELDDLVGFETDKGTVDATKAPVRQRRGLGCLLTVAVVMVVLIVVGLLQGRGSIGVPFQEQNPPAAVSEGTTYYDYNREDVLYFVRTENGGYRLSDSGSADKTLEWSAADDSFYDPTTESWLWYNMDMDPPVWQYWFEGISSDYGDYGWMEHDETGWYIEASRGNWIELPAKYLSDRLWFVEDEG